MNGWMDGLFHRIGTVAVAVSPPRLPARVGTVWDGGLDGWWQAWRAGNWDWDWDWQQLQLPKQETHVLGNGKRAPGHLPH